MRSHPVEDTVLRALRRSRLRSRILVALLEGPASIEELAWRLETRPVMVGWALHGGLPHYAPESSLHAMSLVRRRTVRGRVLYALQDGGRVLAGDIVARSPLYRLV